MEKPILTSLTSNQHTLKQKSLQETSYTAQIKPVNHIQTKILNRKNKYSSFMCLGGDTNRKINNYRKQFFDEHNLIQHTCHFKNICYSNKQNKWLYFAPSLTDSLAEIIQTEQYKISINFNTTIHGFIMLHSMQEITIIPSIVNKPFPNINEMDIYFNKTVVYHYLQWVYNFGHILTDNYYSMYRALYYFHLYNNNECCQSLLNFEWQSAGFDETDVKIPLKFINNLNKYVFNNTQPIFIGYDSQRTPQQHRHLEKVTQQLFNDNEQDIACFKNIVIGTDDFRIWWKAVNRKYHHRWDFSYFIQTLFKDNLLHINKYKKYSNIMEQKILFISKGKNERRRWTNDTNVTFIVEYLKNLFNVSQIDSMEASQIYNGKSLTEQIDFIIPYTLVITACGSVSYIATFMRKGTAMITIDYWYSPQNITSHIDSYIWEYINHRKTYYYYIKQDEYEFPENYVGNKRRKDNIRNNADYRLQASRMSKYVYSALLWIEHYNAWNNTFTKPKDFPIDEID